MPVNRIERQNYIEEKKRIKKEKYIGLFNSEKQSFSGLVIDTIMFLIVILSLITVLTEYNLSKDPSGHWIADYGANKFAQWLYDYDWIFTSLFILEFSLRWIVDSINNNIVKGSIYGYLKFPITSEGILSLLTIIPIFFTVPIFNLFRISRILISDDFLAYMKKIPIVKGVILGIEYLLYAFRKQAVTLIVVTIIFFVFICLFSIIIFNIELMRPGSFFHDPGEEWSFWISFWYTFVTVTTIGYGDIYAVGAAGRIIVVILTFIGIAFIAIYTAVIVDGISSKEIDEKIHMLDHQQKLLTQNKIKKLENALKKAQTTSALDIVTSEKNEIKKIQDETSKKESKNDV